MSYDNAGGIQNHALLSEPDRALLEVAPTGSVEQVIEALQKGANPEARDIRGRTALQLAVLQNPDHEVVRHLISVSPGPDLTDCELGAGLVTLVGRHDASLVKAAIDRGWPLEMTHRTAGTALIFATRLGHSDIVDVLLKGGADPDRTDIGGGGRTALHNAKQAAIVDLLVAAGARMDTNGSMGETPLGYALLVEESEAAMRLIERGAPVNAVNGGTGPLIFAAITPSLPPEVIDKLCRAGANLEERDKEEKTPILAAFDRGPFKDAEHLIQQLASLGADVNARFKDGSTMLMRSAAKDDVPALVALLGIGADPTVTRDSGRDFFAEIARHPAASAAYGAWSARNLMRSAATRQPAPAPAVST